MLKVPYSWTIKVIKNGAYLKVVSSYGLTTLCGIFCITIVSSLTRYIEFGPQKREKLILGEVLNLAFTNERASVLLFLEIHAMNDSHGHRWCMYPGY